MSALRWGQPFLLLATLLLGACSPSEPIKLGFISGQTGRFSDLGTGGLHGAMLAVEQRNAAKGIHGRQISLLVRDDQHDAAQAKAGMQALLDEGVVAVIGPMTSAMATEIAPLANAHKTLLMGGTVVTRKLSGKDDYFVRAIADTHLYALNSAHFQRESLQLKRAVVIYDLANRDYSEDWAKHFSESFEQAGGEKVALIPFDSRKAEDMSQLSTNALQSAPQIVNLVCAPKTTALLAKSLRSKAPKLKLAAAAWAASEQLIELGGAELEGMTLEQYHNLGDTSLAYLAFQTAYTERFHRPADYAAVMAYEASNIVLDGLLHTQRREDLKAAILKQARFTGLQGDILLDANGDATRSAYMSEIRGQQFAPLPWPKKP